LNYETCLLQYPLTGEEVISVLEDAKKAYDQKQSFGGITSHALNHLIEFMKDEENMKLVLNYKTNKK